MTLHTTLNLLRQHNACESGYSTIVAALGSDWPDDKPIALVDCLNSNPVEDVIWALRATIENADYVARMIAADCAESVLHIYEAAYADDRRPREAIDAARAYARGEIDDAALAAARAAAWDAGAAARVAALYAALDAAGAAAWQAALDAAGAAARVAALYAALDAEREKQCAILVKWLTAEKGEK